MTSILVAIADGTEEIECVTAVDIFRRAGAQVTLASAEKTCHVTASRGLQVVADCQINDLPNSTWDLIYLPGGMPGAERLGNHPKLLTMVRQQLESERWLAAICAAPAVILGRHGMIESRHATCYPGFQQELAKQVKEVGHSKVVIDHKLVTSQGPGTTMEFTLTLVELLLGRNKRNEIATQLLFL